MLKLFKWIASSFLTLALIVLVAAIVIPMTVDPNDYRDELTALVKDKTGRELRLEGDLKISVFPWLGIRTEGLQFSQPEKIGGEMVSVNTAQLRVKLIPLLSKRVEVDTVVLEQPQISIITLKDGTDSFAGLIKPSKQSDQVDAGAAVAMVIQGLKVTDGRITIDNRQAGTRTEITQLNLATGNLIGTSLADLNASGQLSQAGNPVATQFDLGARALIHTDTLAVEMERLRASIIQGQRVIKLEADAIAVSPQQKVSMFGLSVNVDGAQTLQFSVPDADISLPKQELRAASLVATVGNLNADVTDLKVVNLFDAPSASGSVNVPKFDANTLLSGMAIDYSPASADALTAVSLTAKFDASMESAAVRDMILMLDKSTLRGAASVRDFDNLAIRFDLSLDSLNLDDYLPAATQSAQQVSGGEALAVPMALFQAINANGRFRANQLIAGGVKLTAIDVAVNSAQGKVEIVPVAQLYQGTLAGKISYAKQADAAALKVRQTMSLVQLRDLLTDADVTNQLSGIGNLDVDVTVTETDGKQSNQGVIKLLANNGEVTGIDVLKILAQANSIATMLSSESSDSAPSNNEVQAKKTDSTEFGELIGTFKLNDFLLSNDDLKVVSPGMIITGFGQLDIAKRTVDYNLRVAIQEGLEGALGKQLFKLQGYTIPVRCRGSLQAPSCLPDMQALYSAYAKDKVDSKKGQLLQEKYGIEGGEKMSTSEAIKQVLIQEALKKDKKGQNVERPIGERDAPSPESSSANVERPIGERATESEAESQASEEGFSNVPVRPQQDSNEDPNAEPEPELTDKQKRREERKKLLEKLLE